MPMPEALSSLLSMKVCFCGVQLWHSGTTVQETPLVILQISILLANCSEWV